MSDEEKRWPFDGFYLKLAEAQREYEQEQHIDPASLTEEERQKKLCSNALFYDIIGTRVSITNHSRP